GPDVERHLGNHFGKCPAGPLDPGVHRDEEADVVAPLVELARKGGGNVRQPARFPERGHLRRDEEDAHRAKLSADGSATRASILIGFVRCPQTWSSSSPRSLATSANSCALCTPSARG